MVRIRIGRPSCELLQTRISSLVLTREEQYNPLGAILAIDRTPEFSSAIKKLGFNRRMLVINGGVTQPEDGLPHLPRSLNDMSVDEALDLIARTFRCIVYYGECPAPRGEERYYNVDYADGSG